LFVLSVLEIEDLTVRRAHEGVALAMPGSFARVRVEEAEEGVNVSHGLNSFTDLEVIGGGTALVLTGKAVTQVARFRLTGARDAGVAIRPQVSFGGNADLDLSLGVVERSAVCIQIGVAGFDVGRLINGVALRECGQPITVMTP